MSALNVEPEPHNGYGWDDLVRIWQETDAPEGCKVEIIEGIVTMAPPPANDHNNIADDLQRELYQVVPREWGIFQTLGVAVPSRNPPPTRAPGYRCICSSMPGRPGDRQSHSSESPKATSTAPTMR